MRSFGHKLRCASFVPHSLVVRGTIAVSTKCRLCEKESDLEISHIIPKFVFKFQKKTSPTGYVRSTENPNRVVQDGIKLRFLCGKCEDLFSKWETKFAGHIFHPYQSGKKEVFEYKDWLVKYLASVSFRTLVYVYEDCGLDYFSDDMRAYAGRAVENLREYLLGHAPHPKEQRQLVILLDILDEKSIRSNPDGMNMYMSRAIEVDVLTTDTDSFIYVKYLKFLQLCPIKLSSNKGWRTARVSPRGGILKVSNHELPDYILDRMRKGAKLAQDSKFDISERQAEILDRRVKENMDKMLLSDIGRSALSEILAKGK